MKKLLLFSFVLCISASMYAQQSHNYSHGTVATVYNNGDSVVIKTTARGQLGADLSNQDLKNILGAATKLRLEGYFSEGEQGDPDILQLKSCVHPVVLDLRDAHIQDGTVSYTYYYLEPETNVRHELSHDTQGYYYTENGTRKNVAQADVRKYTVTVSGGNVLPSEWKNYLTTLYLPTDPNYNAIPYGFAVNFPNLSYVSIPNNITVIGGEAFESTALTSVTLPSNLEAICFEAFRSAPLTSVTIPGTVEFIGSYAFGQNIQLKTLVFTASPDDPNHHLFVQHEAFNNIQALEDVYLETSSKFDCENHAFDFRNTYSHGDASSSTFATLHFSSEVAAHYANLKHPLTMAEATDPAKFHNWLMDHFSQANAITHNNGWWEFINTGTTDEEEPMEATKFLKTYSTYDYDRIVPAGIKAYIVSGFHKAGDGKVSVDLTQIYVIPKRTGVILYGEPNSKTKEGAPTISLQVCEIANGYPLRRDYFKVGTLKNYLWPTSVTYSKGFGDYRIEQFNKYTINASDEITGVTGALRMVRKEVRKSADTSSEQIYLGPEVLGPWDRVSGVYPSAKPSTATGQETYDATELEGFYRNFYLNRYCNTLSGKAYIKNGGSVDAAQYVGFFRVIKNTDKPTNPGQAFLRLKEGEFDDPNGGEVIINGDTCVYGTYSGKILKNYQVEFDPKNEGQVWTPTQSGHWYGDAFTPIPTGKPDMTWTNNDNWGDRSRVFSSPANFVEVMCYDEPNIIDHGNGTATLIVSVQKEENQQGDYYNLQGVKVANPTKGIYIKNGKKVVIK